MPVTLRFKAFKLGFPDSCLTQLYFLVKKASRKSCPIGQHADLHQDPGVPHGPVYIKLNPVTHNSDRRLISPNSITPESNI